MLPENIIKTIAKVNNIRARSDNIITERCENLSVIAPPSNIKIARGIPSNARTIPRTKGSPVNRRTNHGRAIMAN